MYEYCSICNKWIKVKIIDLQKKYEDDNVSIVYSGKDAICPICGEKLFNDNVNKFNQKMILEQIKLFKNKEIKTIIYNSNKFNEIINKWKKLNYDILKYLSSNNEYYIIFRQSIYEKSNVSNITEYSTKNIEINLTSLAYKCILKKTFEYSNDITIHEHKLITEILDLFDIFNQGG